MIFTGLAILIGVFGSILLGLLFLALGIGYWSKPVLRYIFFGLFLMGFYPLFRWVTFDANDTERARAWQGSYDVSCLLGGKIVLNPDQSFVLTASVTVLQVGRWEYVITEDIDYMELHFVTGGSAQFMGTPTEASCDYFPTENGNVSNCVMTRQTGS
ncbi:MAG: hypothetical protein ABI599_07475 [Flavobacteriales bacterium]